MGLIRELVGWSLLVAGLIVFRVSFSYLDDRKVVEAGIATVIGLIIFRGGMQLLKVAVLTRAVVREQRRESM